MEEQNPYRSPAAAATSVTEPLAGARLYKVSGVGLATFIGSTLAGGWLMARNFHALGEPEKANRAVGYSVVATIAILILAFVLPDWVPGIVLTVPQLIAVMHIARRYQGDSIAEYESSGRAYSNWRAFGISLLVLALLLIVVVVCAIALGMSGLID